MQGQEAARRQWTDALFILQKDKSLETIFYTNRKGLGSLSQPATFFTSFLFSIFQN
jgi:hypothetical protein